MPSAARLVLAAGALLAGAPVTGPHPVAAQGAAGAAGFAGQRAVRSARLTAEVASEGTEAEVRVAYTVSAGAAAADSVRVEVLGFEPASVDGVRLELAGPDAGAAAPGGAGGRAVALARRTGAMRAAVLPLPAAPPGADEVRFFLTYRVRGAVHRSGPGFRLRLPVAALDLPPEQGGGPVFHASVRLPEEWSVSGGFPTGLDPTPQGDWAVDLAVVPALVSLRGRTDGAWRPGLPEALDVLALVVLLGFGAMGWRHLRAVAASANADGAGGSSGPSAPGPSPSPAPPSAPGSRP